MENNEPKKVLLYDKVMKRLIERDSEKWKYDKSKQFKQFREATEKEINKFYKERKEAFDAFKKGKKELGLDKLEGINKTGRAKTIKVKVDGLGQVITKPNLVEESTKSIEKQEPIQNKEQNNK